MNHLVTRLKFIARDFLVVRRIAGLGIATVSLMFSVGFGIMRTTNDFRFSGITGIVMHTYVYYNDLRVSLEGNVKQLTPYETLWFT